MRQFLKYELKGNWKSFLISYLLVIISFVLLSAFILFAKLRIDATSLAFAIYGSMLALVGGSMMLSCITFSVNLVKSFYRSIYSNEGYLTLTFPVSPHSLFISKIIANFIFVIGLFLSIGVGCVFMYFSTQGAVNNLFNSLIAIINNLKEYIYLLPFKIFNIFVLILLCFVLLMFSFTLVNLGGARKGKLFFGLLLYMAFLYVLLFSQIFLRYISCGLAFNEAGKIIFAFGARGTEIFSSFGAVSYAFNFTNFVINLGLTIGLYILNIKLFDKKLEIN